MHPVSEKLIERSPAWLRPGVRAVVRTADGAGADRLPGLAAELAFWVLLSLPALLLTAIAAAGQASALIAGDWQARFLDAVTEAASVALTPTTIDDLVVPVLEQLLAGGGIGLISTAFIATLWTASRAIKVVLVSLALVYGNHDPRPAWAMRLLGFVLAVVGIVIGIVLAPLLLSGPNVMAAIDDLVGELDLGVLAELWSALYWPAVVALGMLVITLLYRIGAPGRQPIRTQLPGAVLAVALWLAGSGALRLYGAWLLRSESVYGPLTGPIVLLLWMWLTGFAVLLGAEFNAQRLDLHPVAASDGEADADAAQADEVGAGFEVEGASVLPPMLRTPPAP